MVQCIDFNPSHLYLWAINVLSVCHGRDKNNHSVINYNYGETTKWFSVVAYTKRQVSAMAGTKKTTLESNTTIQRPQYGFQLRLYIRRQSVCHGSMNKNCHSGINYKLGSGYKTVFSAGLYQ